MRSCRRSHRTTSNWVFDEAGDCVDQTLPVVGWNDQTGFAATTTSVTPGASVATVGKPDRPASMSRPPSPRPSVGWERRRYRRAAFRSVISPAQHFNARGRRKWSESLVQRPVSDHPPSNGKTLIVQRINHFDEEPGPLPVVEIADEEQFDNLVLLRTCRNSASVTPRRRAK